MTLVDAITSAFRQRLLRDLEQLDDRRRYDPIAVAEVAADAALELVETLDEIDRIARRRAA